MMRKTIKKFWITCIIMIGLIGITAYQNNAIKVTRVSIKSTEIPKVFDGYKILQLTDIHSRNFGEDQEQLVRILQKENPDLIVITGDLVDANNYDYDVGIDLIEHIIGIAPVFFVYGNHEMILLDNPEENAFKLELERLGVQILNIDAVRITSGDAYINILGIQDPATTYKDKSLLEANTGEEIITAMLDRVTQKVKPEEFTVLLSHRPEYFELYQRYDIDVMLTGHAHGGQFRLPLIGGLWAPNQGFFPKYTSGVYQETVEGKEVKMIVGRGLGNSKVPLRIYNTPEVVCVVLHAE